MFCFVVVLVVLVVVLGDTLIKLQWQDTKLQWQDTKLQWQDTKLQWQDTKLQWQDTKLQYQDSKLHARCASSRSGRSPNCDNGAYCTLAIAMQPCPAALPVSLARQPCRNITVLITGRRPAVYCMLSPQLTRHCIAIWSLLYKLISPSERRARVKTEAIFSLVR
jgi:hypothetical protein